MFCQSRKTEYFKAEQLNTLQKGLYFCGVTGIFSLVHLYGNFMATGRPTFKFSQNFGVNCFLDAMLRIDVCLLKQNNASFQS